MVVSTSIMIIPSYSLSYLLIIIFTTFITIIIIIINTTLSYND